MPSKKKFKPIITRVKLNPEQAVLSCCDVINKTYRVVLEQCSACSLCVGTGVSGQSS